MALGIIHFKVSHNSTFSASAYMMLNVILT